MKSKTVKHFTNIGKGKSFPIGASVYENGVNFSIYSKNSTSIELLLFEKMEDEKPFQTIVFEKKQNRTEFYWHLFVEGLQAGQIYAFRVHGPFKPEKGHYFDAKNILLDPYSKLVIKPEHCEDRMTRVMKSVVVDTSQYNWEGDTHPRRPFSKTIIYELHVKGFTKHPSSGIQPDKRGTYAGLIEKIPYLKKLGITAVELLPIFQFDEQDAPNGKTNYWGYSPISFFAPHRAYSSRKDVMGPLDEFRDMVKALHKAGIEVILDVVFNHTAEGDGRGPSFCYRGVENRAYYLMEGDNWNYTNYSGCGNTINAHHSVVRRMIRHSLRYWVSEMHVDGFRFDLASILSRNEYGHPEKNPPLLWEIESDPVLTGTKLIAEAWDAGGLYQVGHFIGDKWKEWNGKFRDDVRKFIRGDNGAVSHFASRMLGSPDIYGHKNLHAETSVNFVTAHDGFTLYDLVSYNQKHNEANGEDNRDGDNHNISWNCGIEGPTDNVEVNQLRERQIKNFLVATLISYGTPMLVMGDEVGRTQLGNNNAYCQDNEISWFNWELLEKNASLLRFTKILNGFRMLRKLSDNYAELSLLEFLQHKRKVQWHGVRLGEPDWGYTSHTLACTISRNEESPILHMMYNTFSEDLEFEIPNAKELGRKHWIGLIDTAKPSPMDINKAEKAKKVKGQHYLVKSRSIVVLAALPN